MGKGMGFWLGLGLAAGLATATATPAATPGEPSSVGFATELQAVIAAASAVNAQSIEEDREYLGAILRKGADYHYSWMPGVRGADRIQVRLPVPAGFVVVALWHTHGAPAPERRYFSPTDRALVEATGLDLYLADFQGELHVLSPSAPRMSPSTARRLGLGSCRDCAVGDQVYTAAGEAARIPTRPAPAVAVAVRNGQSAAPDLHIKAPVRPDSVT